MIQEAKEIWKFCLANTRAGKAFRKIKNSSSKWILNKPILHKLIQALLPVDVDLFASKQQACAPRSQST